MIANLRRTRITKNSLPGRAAPRAYGSNSRHSRCRRHKNFKYLRVWYDMGSQRGNAIMQPNREQSLGEIVRQRMVQTALVTALCAVPWWSQAADQPPAAASAPASQAQTDVDPEQVATFIKAARFGQDQAVKLYLDRELPINATSNFGDTALIAAAAGGQREIVQPLLAKGADPNFRDPRGATALTIAQDAGNPDAVKLLLAGGAKEIFTYKGMNLNDALILAASAGDAVKVRESLAAGAEPQAASRAGVTPLIAAAYGGNADAVRAVVESGARVNEIPNGFRAWTWTGAKLSTKQQGLAQTASVGDTALIVAARLGHEAAEDNHLNPGAAPALANPHGDTPLSVAAEQGHAKIVALILAKGVDPDEGRQSIPSFSGRAT